MITITAQQLYERHKEDSFFSEECMADEVLRGMSETDKLKLIKEAMRVGPLYDPQPDTNKSVLVVKSALETPISQVGRPEARIPGVTIVNYDEETDDWMKTLPGYKDEVAIHQALGKKYRKSRGKK